MLSDGKTRTGLREMMVCPRGLSVLEDALVRVAVMRCGSPGSDTVNSAYWRKIESKRKV